PDADPPLTTHLSLHDALPISRPPAAARGRRRSGWAQRPAVGCAAPWSRRGPVRPPWGRQPVAGRGPATPAPDTTAAVTNAARAGDRKSTRLNSSHVKISYAVF